MADAPLSRATLRRQFALAPHVRAGPATVAVIPNAIDDAYFWVRITFADGARAGVAMVVANPQSDHSWRLQVGGD